MESEINRWNSYARALRSEEHECFEVLMDACRSYASAGSNATNPILFEPMAISIMLHQQIQLQRLEKRLNDALKQPANQP